LLELLSEFSSLFFLVSLTKVGLYFTLLNSHTAVI